MVTVGRVVMHAAVLWGVGGCDKRAADDFGDFDGFEWDHDWSGGPEATETDSDDGYSDLVAEDACWDSDLGMATGDAVATGNQVEGDNVYDCNGGTGRELVYRWSPPESGRWTITTLGSASDTTLEVRLGCEGESLGCNDDSGAGLTSQVDVDVELGDEVIIVVDSYSSYSEAFVVLNIY